MTAEPARMPRDRSPAHLSVEARTLWRQLHDEYEFGADAAKQLLVALEALDRLRQAQAEIAEHGLTIEGRFGRKLNPAAQVEAEARRAFTSTMKALKLGDEPPPTLSPHNRAAESRWPR